MFWGFAVTERAFVHRTKATERARGLAVGLAVAGLAVGGAAWAADAPANTAVNPPVSAAAGPQSYFDFVNGIFGSWIGRLILLGYTWALIHHMLGGIRHFVWDTGAGMEKHTASKIAWANIIASVVLTLAIWIVGYYARGA